MNIAALSVNDNVHGRLFLTKCEIRKTKTNKPYLYCVFFDGTNEYNGNVWDYIKSAPPAVGVYDVSCTIGEYNGKKQLANIEMSWSADQSIDEFARMYTPPAAVDDLMMKLGSTIQSISNPAILGIVLDVFDSVGGIAPDSPFMMSSSAVGMHHVGVHGNVYHTLEVVELARHIAGALRVYGYDVNNDLIVAGALLHDIGKIDTYSTEVAQIDMTADGRLLDHVYIGAKMIWGSRTARKYPKVARLLEHIILSHHGQKEYGSPVLPSMLEALVVHMADGISASANSVYLAFKKAEDEQKDDMFTDRVYNMGNVGMLRPCYIQAVLEEANE